MKKIPALFLCGPLLILAYTSVSGDDELEWYEIKNATVVTYNISGSSQKELSDVMKRKGPNGYFGYTEWNFKWNCAEITVECTVTMPFWKTGGSTRELQKKWRQFWNNLARHEQGHVDIVWQRVNETKQLVKTMSCRRANDAWSRTLQRVNRESKEYDTRTDHGTIQGAVF